MPKVSVCSPLYNTDPVHLKQMIESVLSQTFEDFEFLLLNDSPDNKEIKEIVFSYMEKRIKYIENNINLGISASRNKLINLSTGEYLAVCDHDDISLPERFEKQVTYLESHSDVGVVSALCSTFGDGTHHFQHHPERDEDIKSMLSNGCYIAHPAAMIRKSVLLVNKIFYKQEYSPAEDYKLWADLMNVTNFHNIQDYLLRYRTFDKNTSVLQRKKMGRVTKKIQREMLHRRNNDSESSFCGVCSKAIFFLRKIMKR